MSKKHQGRKTRRGRHRTSAHRKVGKVLLPPLLDKIPDMKAIRWIEDHLPEFFWIDSLIYEHGLGQGIEIYNRTLDVLDPLFDSSKTTPLLGTVSCFSRIPAERRHDALVAIENIDGALPERLRITIPLYPNHPMSWLCPTTWVEKHQIDSGKGLSYMRSAVFRLLYGKRKHASLCRAIPLNRLFKHNKLFLFNTLSPELLEGISQYPTGPHCDRVESWARSTMNIIMQKDWTFDWSAHFWRHNYQISVCEFAKENELATVRKETINTILKAGEQLLQSASELFRKQWLRVPFDLYEPDEHEVLAGLLSRQLRLAGSVLSDPNLWSIDLGRIMLRCLVEGLITLHYLLQQNDKALYTRFKHHSLGHQKLLQLHLDELAERIEGADEHLENKIEDLQQSLNDEVFEELLPINLGSWTGKDIRRLAIDVGLKDLYDFVFSPSNAEVHGEWISLRDINLDRCASPLHRFHRIPRFDRVAFSTGIPLSALEYLQRFYSAWCSHFGLDPAFEPVEKYRLSLSLLGDEQDKAV